jgi:DNA-3-methyladenine glycosylase
LANRLDRAFFARSTEVVARDLVGCVLKRTTAGDLVSGRIVETEAYGDETDLASHATLYRQSRAEIMRSRPGTVYVYRIYGVHSCLNIVAHDPGIAGAVLIRALEPIEGRETMAARRGVAAGKNLANGPGRLAQALAISTVDNWTDVVESDQIAVFGPPSPMDVIATTRIGITKHTERLWRFVDPASASLSRPVRVRQGRASI